MPTRTPPRVGTGGGHATSRRGGGWISRSRYHREGVRIRRCPPCEASPGTGRRRRRRRPARGPFRCRATGPPSQAGRPAPERVLNRVVVPRAPPSKGARRVPSSEGRSCAGPARCRPTPAFGHQSRRLCRRRFAPTRDVRRRCSPSTTAGSARSPPSRARRRSRRRRRRASQYPRVECPGRPGGSLAKRHFDDGSAAARATSPPCRNPACAGRQSRPCKSRQGVAPECPPARRCRALAKAPRHRAPCRRRARTRTRRGGHPTNRGRCRRGRRGGVAEVRVPRPEPGMDHPGRLSRSPRSMHPREADPRGPVQPRDPTTRKAMPPRVAPSLRLARDRISCLANPRSASLPAPPRDERHPLSAPGD